MAMKLPNYGNRFTPTACTSWHDLGANLAVAGALLQTITRNPLASPTLLSVNSGASLAMVTASAFSPLILSGYSIALVASIGGGLSWFVVMLISNGWKDNSGDRSRVILAGIAVSLLVQHSRN